MQWSDAIDAFARHRRGEGQRASGLAKYLERLALFGQWLRARGVAWDAVTSLDIADYRDHRMETCRTATVLNDRCTLAAFYTWAQQRGHIDANPLVGVRWPKRVRPAPKPLSRCELATLSRILNTELETDEADWQRRRNRLACYLMYYAGLRLGEVARLRVADVDITSATITIRRSKSDDRSVAIHPALLDVLVSWLAGRKQTSPVVPSRTGKPMDAEDLAKIFERWLPRHGLRITAHRLRHTFATEFLRNGGNLRVLQDALGHKSLETTQIYTAVVVTDQAPAIRRLPTMESYLHSAD
jgi:site-specific recombinase XerD